METNSHVSLKVAQRLTIFLDTHLYNTTIQQGAPQMKRTKTNSYIVKQNLLIVRIKAVEFGIVKKTYSSPTT